MWRTSPPSCPEPGLLNTRAAADSSRPLPGHLCGVFAVARGHRVLATLPFLAVTSFPEYESKRCQEEYARAAYLDGEHAA